VLLEQERGTELHGEEFVAGVVADLESSALTEKEKALFRFVDRVNSQSPEISPDDMQPLYAVGWDDEVIYYAVTVCALFNFYNRWIDASGVHALSDEAHRQNAKRSASAGYVRK
jgi:alkylhydroperoxidase family enzyme